jgi:hypothetical protein
MRTGLFFLASATMRGSLSRAAATTNPRVQSAAFDMTAACGLLLVMVAFVAPTAASQPWYAGTWDSTSYSRAEKPRTVVVRVEVTDSQTGLPVPDALVELRGEWIEEWIGTSEFPPRERLYNLDARTADDGVVVFALGWKKEFPWHLGRPEPKVNDRGVIQYLDAHSKWIRAVDDIEKVRELRIRHPDYTQSTFAFDFSHLTQFGQSPGSESQHPRVFEEFERAWVDEMRKPYVRCCFLDLGTTFPEFQKQDCTRPELFVRIRRKDFGKVFLEPANYHSMGDSPQSQCGPYFVYLLEFEIDRRPGVLDVNIRPAPGYRPIDTRPSRNENEEARRGDRAREEQARREREEAERRAREAREQQEREEVHRANQARASDHPIGLAADALTEGKRRELGLFAGVSGVLVVHVKPGSAAETAGLRSNIVIESMDHRTVSTPDDLASRLRSLSGGQQAAIGYWRRGRTGWERATTVVTVP